MRAGYVAHMRETGNKNLVRKLEGKRSHGRCRHRWQDSIKI
jgi:hypothetical protein